MNGWKNRAFLFCSLSTCLLAWSSSPAFAREIHVPADYATITGAIEAAVDGDTILVAPGVYVENLIVAEKSVSILSTSGAETTVIHGNQSGTVVTFDGASSTGSLRGFTITGGTGQFIVSIYSGGGGIAVKGGAGPTIEDCIIDDNETSSSTFNNYGGGVLVNGAFATISNCVISGNHSKHYGGGVAGLFWDGVGGITLRNCSILDNNSGVGGGGLFTSDGFAAVDIQYCLVSGNSSTRGGGMYNRDASSPRYCVFADNTATQDGGGYFQQVGLYEGGSAGLESCALLENQAGTHGGGAYLFRTQEMFTNAYARNLIVARNQAGGLGRGLYLSAAGGWHEQSARVTHCTLLENDVYLQALHERTVAHTIIWNEADPITTASGAADVQYCNIQGGWPGIGNIDADPLFVDPANDDLHITADSPCFDAGNPVTWTPPLDFEGNSRVLGERVDIGADEVTFDCNQNLVPDDQDILDGFSADCDDDLVPDECQDTSADCNGNGEWDVCDINQGPSQDCNQNLVPDECEDTSADCNANGIWDACDILDGTEVDCNGNGVPDACDIANGKSADADGNGVPDECHDLFYVPDDYPTIRDAVYAIGTEYGSVLVADGVYSGTGNMDIYVGASPGENIVIKSLNGPENCIIDCVNNSRGFFLGGGSILVEGFTIQNGDPDSGGLNNEVAGGAIYCQYGTYTIRNCVLRNNNSQTGGAITCWNANATIERCLIIGNTAETTAGAINVDGNGQNNNVATILHCTIADNHAELAGGGIQCEDGGQAVIVNTILWNNQAHVYPEMMLNGGTNFLTDPSEITISYSDVAGGQGGVWVEDIEVLNWGPGNIDADPLFADPSDGDYRLTAGSPCIDSGDPDSPADPDGSSADMGYRAWSPWMDLGNALAGLHGLPLLTGEGTLNGGDPVSLSLTNAREEATAYLILGVSTLELPFMGGIFVPNPEPPGLILPLATDTDGSLVVDAIWPPGLPTGFTIYFQYWIVDVAGPLGFSASNGVAGTTP